MELQEAPVNDVISIGGRLGTGEAVKLQDRLLQALRAGHGVTLDLSAVEGCGLAALQVLLAADQTAKLMGKSFQLNAISGPIRDVAADLGLPVPGQKGEQTAEV